jgi:NADH-ubiquinone oxidoreductase chain 5
MNLLENIIGSLALIGFPFLTGYYSKDLILETAYSKYNLLGYFCYFLGTLGTIFSAFYSIRLCYFTFLSKPLGYKKIICFVFDSNFYICFVLSCLAVPSILIGFILKDMITGVGSNFFGANIFVNIKNLNSYDSEFINVFYKILPINLSLFGLFFAFIFYNFKSKFLYYFKVSFYGKKIYCFFNRK